MRPFLPLNLCYHVNFLFGFGILYAGERLLVIAFPFYRNRIGSIKQAIRVCIGLVVFVNLIHFPFMFSGTYVVNLHYLNKETEYQSCEVDGLENPTFFILFWVVAGIMNICPPIILFIFNVALFCKMKWYNKRTAHLVVLPSMQEHRDREENEAKNLIIVSTITICLSLFLLVLGILYGGMQTELT